MLDIPALPFGAGTHTVTVMVAREGYYDETQTLYFSLNPGVYACHSRALEMVVTGGGAVASGTAVVGDGEWSLTQMSNLLGRWRDRLIGAKPVEPATPTPVAPAAAPAAAPVARPVDMFALLSADFADQLPIAKQATADVMDAIRGVDLEPLARRSPALAGYEWTAYLHCSIARIVRVLRALQQHSAGPRVLDFGSYFGNFSLACRSAGYAVDAIDSYDEYGAAFATVVAAQRAAGVSDSGVFPDWI